MSDLEWLRHVLANDVRAALDRGDPSFVFQPIVDLQDRRLIGVEALARFRSQPHRTPDVWFGAAHRAGLGLELEHAAVRGAVDAARDLPEHLYVAVNISPAAVTCPGFDALVDRLPADRLVLELTEHAPVDDYDALRDALAPLRARGARLAIDDVGAGFASLRHVLSLDPDIIKLDREITGGVETDPGRAKLVGGLIAGASAVSTLVVAEGIESEPQLVRLLELGIRGGQGYLFGRPGELAAVLAAGGAAAAAIAHPSATLVTADARARAALGGALVLVVDDAPEHRRLLRATFELEGAVVLEAATAAQAISLLDDHDPDVVLLDVRLADGSGHDVLAHVELWQHRPVTVFVTAATAVGDRIAALDRGADDYVLKPFSVDELVARVDALLRRR